MKTGSIILKLVDTRYLNDFIKYGELHFGSTQTYRDIENLGGNVGIGDKDEGVFRPRFEYSRYFSNESSKGLPKEMPFRFPANIFCVTQLRPGIETANIIRYDVIRNLYDSLMSDTNYPKTIVAFQDFNIVSSRIKKELGTFSGLGPFKHLESPVHYVDKGKMAEKAQNIAKKESVYEGVPIGLGSILAANFVKNRKFSGEYEYRFALFPNAGDSRRLRRHHDNIRIGNLESQAIIIGSLNDLMKEVKVVFDVK
ncbi:hypothetical protein [Lactiplantibacillus pentosus]|uniref:hypothetical protein n=1 Tax=Lactiplantibacillus pentosus TaxID=1589 RepID=UPI00133004BD|nr:hypothetical protein [Lactiplantibacillus pentosus]MBQ0837329.1 hypothetical protein [Lactiplantibacillus pentosus]MBU7465915.1 hypothetical protein [Lactiplantibacillus pentosus]MBU7491769.1 hypothetical protein [Lactiplantibacillus pentosus]MBU7494599.1 hypothetical protein [Lactiplantibacillus pentosus]MBU7520647.1 hypothetical protein [Lactiplantibacillus pentosus]